MGDISEYRGIIVVVGFMVCIFVLVGSIPPEFAAPSYGNSSVPGSINPNQLLSWNQTYAYNISYSINEYENDFNLQGWNIRFEHKTVHVWPDRFFILETFDWWGPFAWNFDHFHYYRGSTDLSTYNSGYAAYGMLLSTLQTEETAGRALTYDLKNSYTSMTATFIYNKTAYATVTAAYNAGGLSITFGMDWNDRNTSMNAFALMGNLFSVVVPLPEPLNLIVIGVVVGALCYLAFIFALRIVGAVFGGGGA